MAKPFHAGKAAMDGILSAQLAAGGFVGATGILEPGAGLDNAVIQDGSLSIVPIEFSDWRILRNSFKPYAACHLIHPSIDAAKAFVANRIDLGTIGAIRADVGALAVQMTGFGDGSPDTPLAGKFDLRYCVALALHGRDVSAADFRDPWRLDPAVAATASKIAVDSHPDMGFASATVTIDGVAEHVSVAKGHPGNPIRWDDMDRKFDGLVAPALQNRTGAMFGLLRQFGNGRALPEARSLLESLRA